MGFSVNLTKTHIKLLKAIVEVAYKEKGAYKMNSRKIGEIGILNSMAKTYEEDDKHALVTDFKGYTVSALLKVIMNYLEIEHAKGK